MADLLEQFLAGGADELIAVNFAQNHAAGAALKLVKNSFQEVWHEPQKSEALDACRGAAGLLIATQIQRRNAA
jgi:hypothetical protein